MVQLHRPGNSTQQCVFARANSLQLKLIKHTTEADKDLADMKQERLKEEEVELDERQNYSRQLTDPKQRNDERRCKSKVIRHRKV